MIFAAANVQNWLRLRADIVEKYYKNIIKFEGWRFYYGKGFGSWVVISWNAHT
ncbi:hypothetical protein [Flavobacterium urumqiense]|uniref:Alpha-amylase n=1 Tax=Flavobacterium urumqiense TaxID=935224 RepID=A0A1H5X0G3_9FLAO|nr:hypothetical protein [Flavobacterium urumqiense]SEG04746.1 alpha-amylase [Flavobacterium urumqiense]